MPDLWYPVSITQHHVPGGFTIILTTNTPCHLWLYWTNKVPWVHRTSSIKRGLNVPWDSYWCFVSWQLIDQKEPGDTLIHTYQWDGWQHCQTKYFRFHGEIAGQVSPSDSPIFHKHYTEPVPTDFFSYPSTEPPAKVYNNSWVGLPFMSAITGTPSKVHLLINSFGARPYPLTVRIEESYSQPPNPSGPYDDITGHILAQGEISAGDLNLWVNTFFWFTVSLTQTSELTAGTWYVLTTADNDPVSNYRYRCASTVSMSNPTPLFAANLYTYPLRSWTIYSPALAHAVLCP